jgi:hypothetical protein
LQRRAGEQVQPLVANHAEVIVPAGGLPKMSLPPATPASRLFDGVRRSWVFRWSGESGSGHLEQVINLAVSNGWREAGQPIAARFRACFSTLAAEQTGYRYEIKEAALDHQVGNDVR